VPQPLAIWNSARDAWEIPGTEGLFCEHLDVYSETFPTSGMTLNGVAYELPTWKPATDDSESLSLLRTVMADEAGGGPLSPAMAKHRGQTLRLTGQIIDLVEPGRLPQPGEATTAKPAALTADSHPLLPTPVSSPPGGTPENHLRKKPGRNVVTDLAMLLENDLLESGGKLLPTPTVGMMMGGSETRSGSRNGEKLLPGVAKELALLPTGESTNPQSADGKLDSDGQLRGQQNLLDAITATD
jgi:hypothetical protein